MARTVGPIALGLTLLVHGLGSAVFPLRGVDAAGPGTWNVLLTASYVLAILGFVAAGLGVLGVAPFRRTAAVAASAAAAGAFVALWRLGDPDLWPAWWLSGSLPVATLLWSASTQRPRQGQRASYSRHVGNILGVIAFAWIAAATLLWPWHRSWGTASQEWAIALPGDRAPRTPALELLHGVTIDAPPSVVWAWLVQLGQDRAGFYSYESLERLAGVDIHNVTQIRPEWQIRRPGDRVYATQPGYLYGLLGERPGWTVDSVEPDRALVLRQWGAFTLQPTADGGTRFLIRSTVSNDRIPAWAAALNLTAFELPHFIMQRRMMLTIKALAEHTPAARALAR